MTNRREFIQSAGKTAASALALAGLEPATLWAMAHPGASVEERTQDEAFWFPIQQAYTVDRTLINLNNGGVSPAPRVVQEAMKRYLDYSNTAPTYAMWQVLEPQRETVRRRIAEMFGVDAEEIALTRNASEGLQICQQGFDLHGGDELLTTNQDYPRMVNTWKQVQRREGAVLRQFPIPTPCETPEAIVEAYAKHITPRTRLILVSHMIFMTGQIMPLREVAALGRERGIPVLVDGAHAFANFVFKREDLECDYYATSLHKWLCAPHGTGFLYVRQSKIQDLWPLTPPPEELAPDIRKFEEIGTHPAANALAVGDAITFHQGIGGKVKEERLRYLKNRWAQRLVELPNVKLHTSLKPQFSCGIGTMQIEGIDSQALADWLWKKHKIIVSPIKHTEFEGIRISPNVYTSLE